MKLHGVTQEDVFQKLHMGGVTIQFIFTPRVTIGIIIGKL